MKVRKVSMKTVFVIGLLALVFVVPAGVQASFIQLQDPVAFWVIEDSDTPDNQVTLTPWNFFLPSGFQLQYYYSGVPDWTGMASGIDYTFSTGADGKELVYLRLYKSDTEMDRGGELTFSGEEQGAPGETWYAGLIINWAEIGFSLTNVVVGNDDNVAPFAAPIPGAVWLMGSGLLAFLGIRRKGK